MIKRKRKRNPIKNDKKLMRKVAEFLARAIEKEPDGKSAYLLAAELIRRDSLYCEECQSYDIKEDCDWNICYPEIYDLSEESTLDMAKEAAEELAEDLGIVDYVKVFRYISQYKKYKDSDWDDEYKPSVDLSGANLSGADVTGADVTGADLSGADLSGSYLSGSYLYRVNLTGADVTGADLTGAYLYMANLTGAVLTRATLAEAVLTRANLTGANLTGAVLTRATLAEAVLTRANLTGANLTRADLTGANLLRTDFTNTKITLTTDFTNSRNKEEAINLTISNPRKVIANAKKKSNKTKSGKRNIK